MLVLDEPTSGLDPYQVIGFRDLIQSLAESHTVLIASHILPEIEKIASRIMILLDGTLLTADALKGISGGTMLRLAAAAPEAAVRGARLRRRRRARHRRRTGFRLGNDALSDQGRTQVRLLPPDIVAALVGAGVAVSELTEGRPDLEHVFLDLTRRSSRATA